MFMYLPLDLISVMWKNLFEYCLNVIAILQENKQILKLLPSIHYYIIDNKLKNYVSNLKSVTCLCQTLLCFATFAAPLASLLFTPLA